MKNHPNGMQLVYVRVCVGDEKNRTQERRTRRVERGE